MECSEGSSIVDYRLRVGPIEDDEELVEANMDLLRALVRLIMADALTMAESKPVLVNAFSSLRRLNRESWLLEKVSHIESLLEQLKRAEEVSPLADAARQVTQERLDGDWGQGWSVDQWREREAVLLDRMTQR